MNDEQREINRKRSRDWYWNNKDRVRANFKRWYATNKQRVIDSAKRWAADNKERYAKNQSAWRKRMSSYRVEQARKRRIAALQAQPAWAIQFFMDEAYALADLRTKILGFPWQVDHIVPLKSKLVCGLHVHNNLRVIPAAENNRKGNRYWPDMP